MTHAHLLHAPRNFSILPVFLVVFGLLSAIGCAVGRQAPAVTPVASVGDGLTFQFGMGEKSCTIGTCNKGTQLFEVASPEVTVHLAPFAIDIHEVTVEQYRYCEEMGVCSLPTADNGPNGISDYYTNTAGKWDKFPVVLVSWSQAKEYCAFVGKRLPTEYEWERVAGGAAKTSADKRLYPFITTTGPDVHLPTPCTSKVNLFNCTSGTSQSTAVMSQTDDYVIEAGVKIWDLTGNVSEWTASDADEGKVTASCDYSDPALYTCGDCVTCLSGAVGADQAKCGEKCRNCVCGANQTPDAPGLLPHRPNCYAPCGTPICPRYPAATVLEKPPVVANSAKTRMIRGGSHTKDLPANLQNACNGRSDARVLTRGPGEVLTTDIGFRCAKTL